MTPPIRSRTPSDFTAADADADSLTYNDDGGATASTTGDDEISSCFADPIDTPEATASSERGRPFSSPPVQSMFAAGHAVGPDIEGEVFALKGRDAKSGVEVEVFSASATTSPLQDRAQATMARIGMSRDDGRLGASVEVMTAKAHSGTENPDGTLGLNLGAGVTVVGVETTATLGPVTGTLGLSAGASLAGSVGVGDRDDDGQPELCVRAEWAIWTAGGCIERFW